MENMTQLGAVGVMGLRFGRNLTQDNEKHTEFCWVTWTDTP